MNPILYYIRHNWYGPNTFLNSYYYGNLNNIHNIHVIFSIYVRDGEYYAYDFLRYNKISTAKISRYIEDCNNTNNQLFVLIDVDKSYTKVSVHDLFKIIKIVYNGGIII